MPRTSERRNTLRRVRKMEFLVARFLEDNRAVCGYGTEDFLPMTHAIISPIYNRGGSEDAIAEALTAVSDSVYGEPIREADARELAARIRIALDSSRPT